MNILKWIAVLPVALGAMFVVTILGYFFSDIAPNHNPLVSLFASAAFVAAGAYTAPCGKKIVAIVLTAIKCLLPIIGMLISALADILGEYKWYEWLNIVAIIVGAIITAVYICKED